MSAGCLSDRVVEKMLEDAVFVPAPVETAPSPPSFKGESFVQKVEVLRGKAKDTKPEIVHENWEIFRFEDLLYGRCSKPKAMEFVCRKVETPPGKIVLLGHLVLACEKQRIEGGDEAVATIEGIEFKISGSSTNRNTLYLPNQP